MANSTTHAALPYPVYGARFTIPVTYFDSTGTPTDPTTPDTERSVDGAAFTDCTEEVTTITGSNGAGYITLTGDETACSLLIVAAKVASGPKTTLATLYPRGGQYTLDTGTAQAGGSTSITLRSGALAIDDIFVGSIIKTTGGTGGGGGSGSQNNQARMITAYNGSTKVATVFPGWETNPDSTTTYKVFHTENSIIKFSDVKAFGGAAGTFASGIPAASLTSAERTAIATEFDGTIVENNGSFTRKTIQRVLLAVVSGRVSISGSNILFKSPDGVKTRVTVTVDSANQRTAVTIDGTD